MGPESLRSCEKLGDEYSVKVTAAFFKSDIEYMIFWIYHTGHLEAQGYLTETWRVSVADQTTHGLYVDNWKSGRCVK